MLWKPVLSVLQPNPSAFCPARGPADYYPRPRPRQEPAASNCDITMTDCSWVVAMDAFLAQWNRKNSSQHSGRLRTLLALISFYFILFLILWHPTPTHPTPHPPTRGIASRTLMPIFWYQKLIFCSDIRNYFLISENRNFWYQKIISDIENIFWYQKIESLISENARISDIKKSYLFSDIRKWFSDIRKWFSDIRN